MRGVIQLKWTSEEYISTFIQVAETSLYIHMPQVLFIFQINTRTNVIRSSLMFCTQTNNAQFVEFSKNVKMHFFKQLFLKRPGRYKCKLSYLQFTHHAYGNNLSHIFVPYFLLRISGYTVHRLTNLAAWTISLTGFSMIPLQ